MIKKHTTAYLFMAIITLAGIFISGFWGGFMTGAAATLLVLVTIGRHQAMKSAERIDKKVRDIILEKN